MTARKGPIIMSAHDGNDGMAGQVEENTDNVDDVPHHTDQSSKDEAKQQKPEDVKSFSPVVYISLILATFFALGIYEV